MEHQPGLPFRIENYVDSSGLKYFQFHLCKMNRVFGNKVYRCNTSLKKTKPQHSCQGFQCSETES